LTPRLNASTPPRAGAAAPGYAPAAHGIGVAHIGLGAFHKAHQAVYTDAALAARGGDWRIAAISLRNPGPASDLAPQDGLYTVLERGAGAPRARVIGAIAEALHLGTNRARVAAVLRAPGTRVVTITVTEKGYGLDRATGGVDLDHSAIRADLAAPDRPGGLAGLLVGALAARRAAGVAPFTILSCDNLPENGRLLKGLLVDFAARAQPDLAQPDLAAFIEREVATPCCMVDRITPASTVETRETASALIGAEDRAAVETEPFSQWVIEDNFPTARPAWEAGGATLTADVRPFETMKLRMLNGAHSMLAYVGFHAGKRLVRGAMADPAIAGLVARHLAAAAGALTPPPGFDLDAYGRDLTARFQNPAIAHETFQIAMDGTQKLPQRIFAPALEALTRGQSLDPFAFATAAWMRHATGRAAARPYKVEDARAAEIAAALRGVVAPPDIAAALHALPGFAPAALVANASWTGAVSRWLAVMLEVGMDAAVARAARDVTAADH
jgi:fructuronate reductase